MPTLATGKGGCFINKGSFIHEGCFLNKDSFIDVKRGYTLLEVIAVIAVLGLIMLILAAPRYILGEEKARIQYIGKLICADLETARIQARVDQTELPFEFSATGYLFKIGGSQISRNFGEDHFSFQINDDTFIITRNGFGKNLSLSWTTDHFKGSLDVKLDDTVEWKYTRR